MMLEVARLEQFIFKTLCFNKFPLCPFPKGQQQYVHRFVEWSSLDENGGGDIDNEWAGRVKMMQRVINTRMDEQKAVTQVMMDTLNR